MKKAQVSVEYIIIVGFTLLIIIPLIFAALQYSSQGQDSITASQVDEIANRIITTAEQIYYLGEPSKTVLRLNMPTNVESMNIVNNNLFFKVRKGSGTTDITRKSSVAIQGTVPISPGIVNIKIESKGNYVLISKDES